MSFDNRGSTMDGNGGNPEMQSPSASLCKSGCDFYGNPVQEGLCSKCYKEKVNRLQQNLPSNSSSCGSSPPAQNEGRSLFLSPSPSSSSPLVSSSSEDSSQALSGTEMQTTEPFKESNTYVEVVEQALQENVTIATTETNTADSDTASVVSSSSSGADIGSGKPKKNRCLACNKKVGLTGFGCRCGGLFCSTHRYSDMHNCDFDYKEHAQGQIRKNNPVVVGEKITKI